MEKKPVTESPFQKVVRKYFPHRLQILIQQIRDLIDVMTDKNTTTSPRLGATDDDKKLIAPCKCKGTMKYVHRSCLDVWRCQSSRKDSYFKCEQCFNEYVFKGTTYSKFLSNGFVVKILSLTVFILWFYSWFAFIHVGLGHTDIPEDIYYADRYEMYAMGFDGGIYLGFNPSPTDPDQTSTPFTATREPIVTTTGSQPLITIEGNPDNSHSAESVFNRPIVNLIVPPALRRLVRRYHIQLLYSAIILTMFDFVITSPSMILTSNLLFFLWRSYRFGFNVDFLLLMALLAFGLARTLISIHGTVEWLMQRYVKLRCIEIQDLESDNDSDVHKID
jgi:hypothetical protein